MMRVVLTACFLVWLTLSVSAVWAKEPLAPKAEKATDPYAVEDPLALPSFLYGPRVMIGWYSPGRFELGGLYHRVSARQATEVGANLVFGGNPEAGGRGLVLDLTPFVGVHHGILGQDHSMFAVGSYIDAAYRLSYDSLHPYFGAGLKVGSLLGDEDIVAYEIYAHVVSGLDWMLLKGLVLNIALSLSFGYLGIDGHMDLTVDGLRSRTRVRHELSNAYGVGGMIGVNFY